MTLQETPTSSATPSAGFLDVFRSKRMAVLFLLGFSSGLPSLLTGATLQAWMSSIGVDLGRIADLSMVGLAYTLKFAWAPLLDRFALPFLGRRRGWCLALQLALVVAIAVMGAIDPLAQPFWLAVAAIVVAFLSASQDVVIDAYQTDLLAPHERAAGSATYVLGYRIALIVAGTLALIMADHMPWRVIYAIMAAGMAVGIAGTLLADEPRVSEAPPRTIVQAIVEPFGELVTRLGWRAIAIVVAFAALYRFGDYFAQAVVIDFLHRDAAFSLTSIGVVTKGVGFLGTLVGGLAAGGMVARFGLRKMLVAFGVLAAVTNLLYMWLAFVGHDMTVFTLAVGVDHASTALGTSAFIAVLMGVCSPAFSATQFALLTSLSSVGQRVFGPFADDVVHAVGWTGFFASTALMAIPGLALAWLVTRDVKARAG